MLFRFNIELNKDEYKQILFNSTHITVATNEALIKLRKYYSEFKLLEVADVTNEIEIIGEYRDEVTDDLNLYFVDLYDKQCTYAALNLDTVLYYLKDKNVKSISIDDTKLIYIK